MKNEDRQPRVCGTIKRLFEFCSTLELKMYLFIVFMITLIVMTKD